MGTNHCSSMLPVSMSISTELLESFRQHLLTLWPHFTFWCYCLHDRFYLSDEWTEYGIFTVELNFDRNYNQDLFYFCHIHHSMSGRIKLLNNGIVVQEEKPKKKLNGLTRWTCSQSLHTSRKAAKLDLVFRAASTMTSAGKGTIKMVLY